MKQFPLSVIFVGSITSAMLLSSCENQTTSTSAIAGAPNAVQLKRSTNSDVHTSGTLVKLGEDAQKEAGLSYTSAEERNRDTAVKVTGEVLANADLQTHVTTPVTGRVTEVLVRVGDKISEGKPLLNIRSTDIEQAEADLLQNEAQVRADLKQSLLQIDSDMATTGAQLKLSDSTYKRISNLVDEKIASRADFEHAKTELDKDQIALDALKRKRDATIALSKERLELITEPIKMKLRLLGVSDQEITKIVKTRTIDPFLPVCAPETGIISERLVNVGELVDPTKPLFTIGDFHNVWLKADVYEKDVSKVREGQPIELEVDSFPGERFTGRLGYVSDSINPDSRTLTVRAEVPNPGLKLKPKMFARMRILVGEHRVLTIPSSAVQDAGTAKVVYVPKGNGVFEERTVKLGSEFGDQVEVLSGIKPGERVVTHGSFDLRSESLRES